MSEMELKNMDLKTRMLAEIKAYLESCTNTLIFLQDLMGMPQMATILRAEFPKEIALLENLGVEL